jgi:hypothetical protein
MDKYKPKFEKRVKPRMNHETGDYVVEPFRDAQSALVNSQFAAREREQFFGDAFGEILADLFVQWLKTESHCTKEREYLYHVAMALGSVKEKLVGIETYGANIKFIKSQEEGNKEDSNGQEDA